MSQGSLRHPQLPSQIIEPPLVGTEIPRTGSPVRAWPRQPFPRQELVDYVPIEAGRTTGRTKPLGVEPLSNRLGRRARVPQFDQTSVEALIVAELLIFLNGTADLVPGLPATTPTDRDVDPLGPTADGHRDSFDQAADDGLPILDGGAGIMPQLRNAGGQSLDPPAIGISQLARCPGREAVILLSQRALLAQGLFPPPLQLARDQTVLGLDGVVLARGAFGLDASSLQSELPVLVLLSPLALQIGHGRGVQLQRRRLEGSEHLLGDQCLEGATGEALTNRLGAAMVSTKVAHVIDRCAFGVVGDSHPPTAPTAIHQATQQRWPTAGAPTAVGRKRLAASRPWLARYRSQVM